MDQVLSENSESLNSAIKNIDTFAGALARNSDKVDGILAGIERMTGGGTSPADMPVYDLVAATDFPSKPAEAPSWTLVVPEPSTLMGFNTDKILLQPEAGESVPVANARWGDNLPILFQAKVVQSFENAGYAQIGQPDSRWPHRRLSAAHRHQALPYLDGSRALPRISTSSPSSPTRTARSSPRAPSKPPRRPRAAMRRLMSMRFDEAFAKLETDLVDWTTTTLASEPPIAEPRGTCRAARCRAVGSRPRPAPDSRNR